MSTVAPCRRNRDRRPAPPRSSGMPDELDRTARQVRLDRADSTVHDVHASYLDPSGMAYLTRCDNVLVAADGAILTTREATCGRCLRGGR